MDSMPIIFRNHNQPRILYFLSLEALQALSFVLCNVIYPNPMLLNALSKMNYLLSHKYYWT